MSYYQLQLQQLAEQAAARKIDATRHKCFVSYHAADTAEVATFLDDFGSEFIAKTIGVTDADGFIDSENTDCVMDQIRTKYLGNSTVTIVLVGKCTWARRYVDWEVYSSLRDSKLSTINGLLVIQLPSAALANPAPVLPARVSDNVVRDAHNADIGYARYYVYPESTSTLRSLISEAFDARTTRKHLIDNTRARRMRSASCS